MWSPIDIFFIAWFCNFSPDQNARLTLSEVMESRERVLIEKIVQKKENSIINSTIRLRDGV